MNKELEAFRELKEHIEYKGGDFYCANESRLNIIETALKDYENLKEVHFIIHNGARSMNKQHTLKVLKKLKALEIIKEKRVDVSWLMKCFGFIENSINEEECEYYNNNYEAYRNSKSLTQEEYNLLKEELQ